jgi:hypothetical protein
MDPLPPIVIQHPDILPVARAHAGAPVSRDGRGQGGRQDQDRRRRSPEGEPPSGDEAELEELSAGEQTPHLLDVVVDEEEAEDGAPEAPAGGHIDLTA